VYADDDPTGTASDPYTITVDLVDEDGTHAGAGTKGITVENVAPVIGVMTVTPGGGHWSTGFEVYVEFTDPSSLDTHVATIDWGDGTVHTIDPATSPITDTHVYGEHPPYPKTYTIEVTVTDDDTGDVSETRTVDVQASEVVGRHIFYNNCYWDGDDPAANTDDDNAIAPSPGDLGDAGVHDGGDNQVTLTDSTQSWVPNALVDGWESATIVVNLTDGSRGTITANTATTITATLTGGAENDWDAGDEYMLTGPNGDHSAGLGKTALLPGQWATFANYTSYDRGINGIMVDVANLADPDNLDETDFIFRVGNDNDPGSWPAAPAPASVSVRPHPTEADTSRITITWPGNAIEKQWLQVTVLAGGHTGLAENDIFYWGNAPGDSGLGNTSAFAFVTVTDELAARHSPHNLADPASIEDFVDYNHDRWVTVADELIARHNGTNLLNALKLITVPASSGGGAGLVASGFPTASPEEPVLLGFNQPASPSMAPALAPAQGPLGDSSASPAAPAPLPVLAAYDAVLGERAAQQSSSMAAPAKGDASWLNDFESPFAEETDSEKQDSAVDEVLGADWLYE
jgi:hypothetical protein